MHTTSNPPVFILNESVHYSTCDVSFVLSFFHQMTPFHVAAERGRCEEILEHLLSKGGDIDIKNDDGVSDTAYIRKELGS